MQTLFGPLDRAYCNYFYYLSIFFFALFAFAAAKCVLTLVKGKKLGVMECMMTLLQPLLMYFINRLYFSMCVGSLN